MKIEFGGKTWKFDLDEITLEQAERVEKETGLTLDAWNASLFDLKPVSYRLLYWVLAAQNGDPLALEEVSFKFGPFVKAWTAAVRAEADALNAAQEGVDPTGSSGTGPSTPTRPGPSPGS
jgi:hypothetical protein